MSLLVFEFYLQLLGGKVVKDVTALRVDPQLAKVVVEYQAQVILMFSKNSTSPTITYQSDYEDVLDTIKIFFRESLHFAKSKGVLIKQIVLDPGMVPFQWC